MVHWLGEGTNVMLCLAREPPPGPLDERPDKVQPSSVYISFDNGDTFVERTDLFQVNISGTMKNSTLDQFITHPNYNTVSYIYGNPIIHYSADIGSENNQYDKHFDFKIHFWQLLLRTAHGFDIHHCKIIYLYLMR